MQPDVTTTNFQPLSFGDLLERALKVYWRNLATFALIVGVLTFPPSILFALTFTLFPEELIPTTEDGTFAQAPPQIEPEEIIPFFAAIGLTAIVWGLTYVVARGACYIAAEIAYAGDRPRWGACTAVGFRRMLSLLWLALLEAILIWLAIIAVSLPGIVTIVANQEWWAIVLLILNILIGIGVAIWLGFSWSLARPALLTENVRGIDALRRSYRLVSSDFWKVAALLVVVYVGTWIVGSVLTAPVTIFTAFAPLQDPALMIGLSVAGNVLTSLITLPVTTAVVASVYLDQRARKEGLAPDQLRAELQLPAVPPAGPIASTT